MISSLSTAPQQHASEVVDFRDHGTIQKLEEKVTYLRKSKEKVLETLEAMQMRLNHAESMQLQLQQENLQLRLTLDAWREDHNMHIRHGEQQRQKLQQAQQKTLQLLSAAELTADNMSQLMSETQQLELQQRVRLREEKQQLQRQLDVATDRVEVPSPPPATEPTTPPQPPLGAQVSLRGGPQWVSNSKAIGMRRIRPPPSTSVTPTTRVRGKFDSLMGSALMRNEPH